MKFTVVEEPSGGVKTRLVWGDGGGAQYETAVGPFSPVLFWNLNLGTVIGSISTSHTLGACPLDHMYVNLH